MLYLATASTAPVREAMRAGLLGQMRQPRAGNPIIPGVPWAADNGCFSAAWKPDHWLNWLKLQPTDGCLFAVVPDVVGDAQATRQRWEQWAPAVRELDYPLAYVLQDGETGPPWEELDCLFVGGSTAYKESTEAQRWTFQARQRGKWTHMGRVNTLRRLRLAEHDGYDSVDGTVLAYGPDIRLPILLKHLRTITEPRLFSAEDMELEL